ncbi:MAG TPA: cbb3-type cytochrome c oxidase subunit I [Candidatus Thermoplasmatota archaeon]|nr:cbb3-type cytochrome c oxidase subunit I [Candidatus Thermoplasmatota archaeon]
MAAAQFVMADTTPKRKGLARWLTTTDHKEIGLLYLWTALVFFVLGGISALLIRMELFLPGVQIGDGTAFNEFFSLHGTTMVFLWIMPAIAGLGNYFVPIMVKAKDMAFPRVNALSFWLIPPAGLLLWLPMVLKGLSAVNVTWVGYPPVSTSVQNFGLDMWILALILLGMASTMGAVNFLVTLFRMRGPGVTLHNMPLFCWAQLATSILLVFSLPVVTVAFIMLLFERNFGTHFFSGVTGSDPILYQHLFWFFGHPEVYVLVLPLMGVLNEIIPKFSRRPVFGYTSMAYAMLGIAIVGFVVWAHHMFTTGLDPTVRAVFMFNTMLVGVPTGIKVFNWLATMWGGQINLRSPMKFCLGFIWLFVIGGITGVMLGSIPVDYALHDSYFVVAHFHYTMVGGAVFGIFAGIYYWYPFLFGGRMFSERLANWHFWLMFAGFNLTFFPQFILGLEGMARRIADYDAVHHPGWEILNQASTVGAFLIASSVLFFFINVWVSHRRNERVVADPWGGERHVEWKLWEEGRVVHGKGLILDEEPVPLAKQEPPGYGGA